MLPNNPESWIFIIVACLIGFGIGQWLKARRDKVEKNKNAYRNSLKRMALADNLAQIKKAKRKKQKNKPGK